MSSNSIVFDPARRQVLPLSAAVNLRPFRDADFERAQVIREVLDMGPVRPRIAQPTESVTLEGNLVTSEFTTGGELVARRRFVAAVVEPELALAPLAFEVVADTSIQSAAAVALAAMNERPHARRGARLPRKPIKAPRTASTGAMWAAFTIAALVVAMLAVTVVKGSLL
jgi:hypothetical protein